MKKLIIALLAITGTVTHAAEWKISSSSENAVYLTDITSIVKVGRFTKAWVKTQFWTEQETQTYPKKKYSSNKLLYYFDCSTNRYSVVQYVAYTGSDGDGELVDSQSIKFDPESMSDIVPETIAEGNMKFSCSRTAKPAKQNPRDFKY